ncbi:MAG: gliding motility-associated C-terminal domain-containing protein, partial [Bacteroidia bacterium]
GLTTGTVVLRWTVKNGVCPSTFDDFVITRALPPPNAIAGPDQSIIENETQLSATTPSIGTGLWELIEGKANITDPSNPLTKVTGLQEGNNVFRWTIHKGSCSGDGDDVIVDVKPLDIPNGFSPNEDGINDHFEIPSLDHFNNVKFTVYNRWGGLVYHNDQYKNTWKGTNMSNEHLADDTYYYTLEVPAKKNYSGFIILKKNK